MKNKKLTAQGINDNDSRGWLEESKRPPAGLPSMSEKRHWIPPMVSLLAIKACDIKGAKRCKEGVVRDAFLGFSRNKHR